jgi:hypothetical protein
MLVYHRRSWVPSLAQKKKNEEEEKKGRKVGGRK